ncbi:MAG TPA: winged helix-turn-helix domain-containing protein [Segeticoccus sp.]|uniref:ArsR/SmtB family transcription factor n=1 Tax=Segeticoccus sp. TaxID=2706531 RepID=UPI002D7F098A|nr:winged helix-turn-helix domain-containing protein [Segeticoccus sp.]HET8601786.1 winged helix-turn-helix domain-containing protein [Segeticoccus sp.]
MTDQSPPPAEAPRHSWHPDPQRDVVVDGGVLRALAHPLRSKLLALLRQYGPSTATALAERLGVNSGATSYHLRQLAEAGLVVEDAERGNARERWWKAAHRSTYFDEKLFESEPELASAFLGSVAQGHAQNMALAIEQMPTMSEDWRAAVDLSDFAFHLTAAQLKEMLEQIREVLDRYRTDEDDPQPEGARRVVVQLQAFPQEGR